MNPPTEQLIRDYLNRVSVAARGRLGADDRRAFLARTRESIEQSTRARGHTDSTDVLRLLSGLGDPVVLVDRERDRLASQRMGAAAAPPGQAVHVPEPAPDVPLTGALQFQTRPITSRWRPGAPMVPKPPRQRRAGIPRRLQPDGRPPGNMQEHPAAAEQPVGVADQHSAGSPPPLPADVQPRFRRPQWPVLSPGRRDTGGDGQVNGQALGGEGPISNGEARSNGAQPAGTVLNGVQLNGTAADLNGTPADTNGTAEEPNGTAEESNGTAEEPLSGPWPDLGPIGAGAGRLARTVLARARRRPLEAIAVLLLSLGGLIYPPVWLLGAAVALVSRVWDFRDKWIGLAVPVFLVIVGMVADVSLGGTRSGLSGYAREAWMFGGHISRVAAVLGAVYLAWRAERGRRSPPVPPWNKPHRFG